MSHFPRRMIVWCEAHRDGDAHPLVDSCVHPHDVGPAFRAGYLDKLVEVAAAELEPDTSCKHCGAAGHLAGELVTP